MTCIVYARSSYPEAESDTAAQQNLDKSLVRLWEFPPSLCARLTRMIQSARAFDPNHRRPHTEKCSARPNKGLECR